MRVAVIGIGNELLMDEGAGPACVRYFRERFETPACVDVLDRSVMGMAVVSDLREYDVALVLDVVEVPGATPGQLFSFAPEDALGGQTMGSLHEMRFADVLSTAELMGVRCKGHCMGVQAENISPEEFAMALTPRVAAAVPLLAAFAARWLRTELGIDVRDRFAQDDPLRAGGGAQRARNFGPEAPMPADDAPDICPAEALPTIAGCPDVSVMAHYLRAGLAAVGVHGVGADEPAGVVRFILPASSEARELAGRFGLAAEVPAGGGEGLACVAHVHAETTDYDCDALVGGVQALPGACEEGC